MQHGGIWREGAHHRSAGHSHHRSDRCHRYYDVRTKIAQPNRGYQPNLTFQQPPRVLVRPSRFQQPSQYQQPQQFNRPGFQGGRIRPGNYTWHARNQQQRQGNFGFNRQTPTNFAPPKQNPTNPQNTTASALSSAAHAVAAEFAPSKAVASVEDTELMAQPLCGVEEQEATVTLTYDDFVCLQEQAGYAAQDCELSMGMDQLSF